MARRRPSCKKLTPSRLIDRKTREDRRGPSRIPCNHRGSAADPLLTRSTLAVTLTEAGADYLARCEMILAALDEADHAARGTGELRGILRVATSTSFASRTVMPRLTRFADKHPKLRIEFALDDARHDLIGESVDVAVRIGTLDDSTAVAPKIGTVHRVLVAAPSSLASAGTPLSPSDLAEHTFIIGPAGRSSRKGGKTPPPRPTIR